jgi:hypothetical protein
LKPVSRLEECLQLMLEGWHLAAASFNGQTQRWEYLMGRPDVGLPYDPELDTYDSE